MPPIRVDRNFLQIRFRTLSIQASSSQFNSMVCMHRHTLILNKEKINKEDMNLKPDWFIQIQRIIILKGEVVNSCTIITGR